MGSIINLLKKAYKAGRRFQSNLTDQNFDDFIEDMKEQIEEVSNEKVIDNVEISFEQGVILGSDVREFLKIFPELKDNFSQRKGFDEYYFHSAKNVKVSIEQFSDLSKEFHFSMYWSFIKIIG